MKTTSAAKRAEGDLFNEDLAELQFLRSKPTCFFIVGKSVSSLLLNFKMFYFGSQIP